MRTKVTPIGKKMNLKKAERIRADAQEVANAAAMCCNAIRYDVMATKRPPRIIIGPPEPKELVRTQRWLARSIKELRLTLRGYRT